MAALLATYLVQFAGLDRIYRLVTGAGSLGDRLGTLHRSIHLVRDVIDRHELVQPQHRRRAFLLERARVEALVQEMLTLLGHLRKGTSSAVMIGHHKAVRRHERGSTVRQSQRTQSRFLKPLLGGVDAILRLEELDRRIIERPHLSVVECTGSYRLVLSVRHIDARATEQDHRHDRDAYIWSR